MSQDDALRERLDFMKMDRPARERIRKLRPMIEREIGPALEAFYRQVRAFPQTSAFFPDDRLIDSASSRQQRHWGIIAAADYGDSYAEGVRRIGQAHARLGLEPRWYIGGYALVSEHLVRAAIVEAWPKSRFRAGPPPEAEEAAGVVSALVKAVLLDMDLAISIYLDALEARRAEAETTRIAAEQRQTALVGALGRLLTRLAEGDLTARLEEQVAPEFTALKDDYNAAVDALRETLQAASNSTTSLRASAQEIAQASDDLSRRTEQQAASLEETAAALEELTATVKRSAAGARQAAHVVSTAKAAAEESGQVVSQAVSAMGQIEKSAGQIAQIIGVIDEIAFQTNLLALNAGVEAARAGEAGKGFAVVASEVRSLAQRSAEAAKEIKSLIGASSQQVDQGVDLVGRTGEALRRIVAQVDEIDVLVSEIAGAAEEQSTGLVQINTAINEMDRVTQQNAAMVEQATAATHSLNQETSELAERLSRFRLGSGALPMARAAGAAWGGEPLRLASPRATPKPAVLAARERLAARVGGSGFPPQGQSAWEEF